MREVSIAVATEALVSAKESDRLFERQPRAHILQDLQAGAVASILYHGGEAVGFAMVRSNLELVGYILDGWQGRGLGTRLGEHLLAEARERGRLPISVRVFDGDSAHKIVLGLGFQLVRSKQTSSGVVQHLLLLDSQAFTS